MLEESGSSASIKQKNSFGFRHVQMLMLFVGLALAYGMRATMSIAVIAIANDEESTPSAWSTQIQTIVLSSFMVGYVVSQVPGRRLASRFGGKLFMVVGVALSGVVAAFIPLGAYDGDWQLVIALRFVQGMAQGAMVPGILNLIENWTPLEERKLTVTLILCATLLGVCLQFLISGFVITAWGWAMVFYLNTITGIVWSILYIIIGSKSAETSRFIKDDEKEFIENSLEHDNGAQNLKTPWYAIWTSLPFLALVVAACAQNWIIWTLITLLPMYFNHTQEIEINRIGVLSALPFLAMFLMILPFRYISIAIINKTNITITTTRKIFSGIAFFGPAIGLITSVIIESDAIITTMILTLAMMLNAAQYFGFMLGPEDMAPNFSQRMSRITNGVADLVSIFAPLTAGIILTDENQHHVWRYVFYLSAALSIVCGVIYVAFGTSKRQPWNLPFRDSTHIRSPYLKQESRRD